MQFYRPEINASLLDKLALLNDLRSAVRDQGISAFYQPIVDGQTGELIGLESLARWHCPQRGPVPPGRFITLAEETGLIGELGTQMLALACSQLLNWDRAGLWATNQTRAPYLSVNVSPLQVNARGFVAGLRKLLSQTGLAAQRLQIELTEGAVMADPQRAALLLEELAGLGVRIALDDFGTGHSSLAYLRNFPIHCIKIDRTFIGDLGQSDRHASIVPAILAIAQSLGAAVVAEGVEHDNQRQTLLKLGCRGMQGYWFAQPMSATAATHRLRQGFSPPPGEASP